MFVTYKPNRKPNLDAQNFAAKFLDAGDGYKAVAQHGDIMDIPAEIAIVVEGRCKWFDKRLFTEVK